MEEENYLPYILKFIKDMLLDKSSKAFAKNKQTEITKMQVYVYNVASFIVLILVTYAQI